MKYARDPQPMKRKTAAAIFAHMHKEAPDLRTLGGYNNSYVFEWYRGDAVPFQALFKLLQVRAWMRL